MRATSAAQSPEPRRIAVITTDPRELPAIQQFLAPSFDVRLLNSWTQVAPLLSETTLDGVLLDLDTQGTAPALALEYLVKLRAINQDLLLVAVTRTQDRELRLKAAEVPVDEFFVAPIDFRRSARRRSNGRKRSHAPRLRRHRARGA